MNNKILVVIIPPEAKAYKANVDDSLDSLQNLVGGLIEVIPFSAFSEILKLFKNVDIIINEEGKFENLPCNIFLRNDDYIAGTAVMVGRKESEIASLTQEQADILVNLFNVTRVTREKKKAASAATPVTFQSE